MKFEIALRGQPALVVPNGIPLRCSTGRPGHWSTGFRRASRPPRAVESGPLRPRQAVVSGRRCGGGATRRRLGARLLVRGGREPYGADVFARARSRGWCVAEVTSDGRDAASLLRSWAPPRRRAIPGVLAGGRSAGGLRRRRCRAREQRQRAVRLVGLEVMASGGLAVCGSTGEDYAEPFVNAIVVDTATAANSPNTCVLPSGRRSGPARCGRPAARRRPLRLAHRLRCARAQDRVRGDCCSTSARYAWTSSSIRSEVSSA